jgi:hypothetical protein
MSTLDLFTEEPLKEEDFDPFCMSILADYIEDQFLSLIKQVSPLSSLLNLFPTRPTVVLKPYS